MGRQLRVEYPGALYHITSRGNERKEIFFDDSDREYFLGLLGEYHERYGVLIHSYVLMDNHYHLILETPQGNLLKVMHGINGKYTNYFNRAHQRIGHLFQGRYKGIVVDKDAYLLTLSRYVHLNPVRAGMAERPEEYPWSSYPAYIGRAKENKWVEYSWVLSKFDKSPNEARRGYRAYVAQGMQCVPGTPLREVFGQIILGDEDFQNRIRRMLNGKKIGSAIVEKKRLREQRPAEVIINEVCEAFGVKKEILTEKGQRDGTARKVAIYLTQQYSGLSNGDIGKLFGSIHISAVSKAVTRLKVEIAADKKLSKRVEELVSIVKP